MFDLGKELSIFGVFDGHGGNQVAEWVRDNFVKELVKLKSYKDGDYKEALRETFILMDELMKTPMVKKELQKCATDKDSGGGMSDIAGFTMGTDVDIANSVGCTAWVCIINAFKVILLNNITLYLNILIFFYYILLINLHLFMNIKNYIFYCNL